MHSGRPKARNTGLEAAEGDIVLFNDDDILINPECLKYHMDCHLTNRDCIVLGQIICWICKKNSLIKENQYQL